MENSELTVRNAYAECRRLAQRHYENFPVASYLVPRDKRDALAAIYAFARHADDLADEPRSNSSVPVARDTPGFRASPGEGPQGSGLEPGEPAGKGRLEALAEWRQKLRDCYAGRAEHPVFIALRDTVERFRLSPEHFGNLLRAFEQDVLVNRRPDFCSLLAYCACSANPVGRLVLELFGHRETDLFMLSDHICTALQLTNFWQDVVVDLERDRVYLPLEDLQRYRYTLEDLRAHRANEHWRELMAFEIARTRELFEQGRALPEKVVPGLRRQLRLTWLGGMTILGRIEAAGYDVFRQRPALRVLDFIRLYFRARRTPVG
jgi:phytoene synthase